MKGKNLLLLLVLVAVLGGAWYFLAARNQASWSASGSGGGKVAEFPLNDVSRIVIKSATSELNLVKKGDAWTVQERADYPANFDQVSSLLRKLWELKTVQEVKVGASQLPRLQLVEPGQGDQSGTLVSLLGADGKPLQALLLGKKQMRKSEGGGEMDFGGEAAGFPTGRYVKPLAGAKVSLVSEVLDDADPKPERWLIKDFIKIESPKSIAVVGPAEAQRWTVSRESATGEWKLADAKPEEKLDTGKVSPLSNVFSSASFSDVQAPDAKLEEPVTTAAIQTFDGLQYELKIGKASGENYPVTVKVTANPPKERTPVADEKPEVKTKLDTEFADKQKQLQEKLTKEQKFEGRIYLVAKFSVDPLLKDRAALLAEKPPEPAKPADPAKPSDPTAPKPAEAPKPVEVAPKPAEVPQPVEPAKPVEPSKPAEPSVPTEPAKPAPEAAPKTPPPPAPPQPPPQ